jgi:hypothetical protein
MLYTPHCLLIHGNIQLLPKMKCQQSGLIKATPPLPSPVKRDGYNHIWILFPFWPCGGHNVGQWRRQGEKALIFHLVD